MKRLYTSLALFAVAAMVILVVGCDRSLLPTSAAGPQPRPYDAIGVSGRSVMYFNPSDGATVSRPAQTTASAFLLRFSWSCQPIAQYFVLYRRDGTAPDQANRVRSIYVGSASQSWIDVDLNAPDIPPGLYVWGVELGDGGRSQLQGLGIK